jgi:hypothetical protein
VDLEFSAKICLTSELVTKRDMRAAPGLIAHPPREDLPWWPGSTLIQSKSLQIQKMIQWNVFEPVSWNKNLHWLYPRHLRFIFLFGFVFGSI